MERAFANCRRDAGLDLHRAATRLRVNPQYLRRLELGHLPLSMPLASRMTVVYGTTLRLLTEPVGTGGTGTAPGRGPRGNGLRPTGEARHAAPRP